MVGTGSTVPHNIETLVKSVQEVVPVSYEAAYKALSDHFWSTDDAAFSLLEKSGY
jgi:hypothetical protein